MTNAAPSGVAIVLVVEDEPLQRLDMIDIAEEAGFKVLEAHDADHAIELLEKRPDVRLVLTDVDMPGAMNGLKLAAAVRKRWPPIKIIVTTAGVRPAAMDLPEGAVFLPKPLNHRRVVDAMHRLIA